MEIEAGTLTAFYLYDVADQIDLVRLRATTGAGAEARLAARAPSSYLQYQTPPLVIEGDQVGMGAIDGFRPRLKFFDYGVVSLSLHRPFCGSWADLIAASQTSIENEALEAKAEAEVRRVVARCAAAMTRVRERYLSEDYLVILPRSSRTRDCAIRVFRWHETHTTQPHHSVTV